MTETTPSSKTRPPKQSRTGLKANGTRKAASKSNRSRAREFALQALYQHIVGRNDAAAIDSFTRDLAGFHKADAAHYNAVLHGCINTADDLDALITPLLDRQAGRDLAHRTRLHVDRRVRVHALHGRALARGAQ